MTKFFKLSKPEDTYIDLKKIVFIRPKADDLYEVAFVDGNSIYITSRDATRIIYERGYI